MLEVEASPSPGKPRPRSSLAERSSDDRQFEPVQANQGSTQEPDLGPSGQGGAAVRTSKPRASIRSRIARPPRENRSISTASAPGIRGTRARPCSNRRAGSLDLEPHQLGEGRREPERPQIGLGIAESLSILARQVDPADGQVAGHVLPEVGQLQRGAGGVGQAGVLVGVRTGHMEHQMAHRVGRSRAIVHELSIGLVFGDRLILHERVDQGLERVDRNLVASRRSRASATMTGCRAWPWYMARSSPRHQSRSSSDRAGSPTSSPRSSDQRQKA